MRHHIPWPDDPKQAPVYIRVQQSVDEILQRDFLPALLKSRELHALGVMFDADAVGIGRYQHFRELCVDAFPEMPLSLPIEGLVVSNADGKRLGLWIMP